MAEKKKTPAKKAPAKKVVKKTTVKKTVTKKAPAKKTTTRKPVVAPSTYKKANDNGASMTSFLPWLLVLFLGAALLGSLFMTGSNTAGDAFSGDQKIVRSGGQTFVSVKNLDEAFLVELGGDNEFAVYDGQTWIPVAGEPIELIVLTDETCDTCNPADEIAALRQNITPAFMVREVDFRTLEGQVLVETFDIKAIPQFVLAEGASKFKSNDGTVFVDNAQDVLIARDDLYLINSARVGFKTDKYLEAPKFADLSYEPRQGNGKIQVVEFTDYQCPYCKRLHDQNKDLIQRLVAEGKITYILKDFPLSFHREAVYAHRAANCVLEESGNDAYWDMNAKIFETQQQWPKGNAADQYFVDMASGLEVDIASCMKDEDGSLQAEIDADQAEGSEYGVTGTPALFIGAQFMPGAISPQTFEAAVNDQL